ncbi:MULTISPECIES: alpha/beta fold hydrolase [unclassified Polaromonas]|uniref:alpha/beta fold hydrolase n=1 Tax=unclassified Polaromonas TaxID=2638319 RepID=UPI000F07423B|nr:MULTISPECIES: alpha/beta fold hydrolase [unclassified Polaromonas]AYQ29561.1 alpha/beta fold hydrolase [Polaromonas sp. SP1]QGJ19323.1 alpha/beta fold hydrolase [Polaromonas sp. Pch-P]
MRGGRFALAGLLLGLMGTGALAQAAKCPDGRPADGIERAGDARHCLVIRTLPPGQVSRITPKVLVVFLHGDNGGRIELKADSGTAAVLAEKLQAVTIAMQRPGYRSDLGTSDGESGAGDDDYTPRNTEIMAAALGNLRSLNPGKKILLIGHSGGAAMAALLASRFPGSADAYLLAACPCDVPAWRQWRGSSAGKSGVWSRSISPLAEAAKASPDTLIRVVVGNKDENTLSLFSESYVRALQARGVKTRVTYAMNATHVSVQRSPEFFMLAGELADTLSK